MARAGNPLASAGSRTPRVTWPRAPTCLARARTWATGGLCPAAESSGGPLAVRGRTLGTLTVANRKGGALLRETELRGRLQNAVEELDRVIRDLRNYIFGLRPGILADRQLDQALHGLVEEFEQRTGVLAIAEVDPQDDGRGFDPAKVSGAGQGLHNLRERAEPWAAGPRSTAARARGRGSGSRFPADLRVRVPRAWTSP
jgi:signal transduction histidine kinase